MNYIPLRVKTNYSLLTSLNTIESLAKRAKELNINALSITDDNMFGVMEFYKTMLKYDIKPIIGLEVKINDYSILLYAENYKEGSFVNKTSIAQIGSTKEIDGITYILDGWYPESDPNGNDNSSKISDEKWSYSPTDTELADGTVNFYAHYTPLYTSVEIKKLVTGNMGDKSKEFHFKVSVVNGNINLPFNIDETQYRGSADITLSDNQTTTLTKILVGATVTITEDDYSGSGYTTSYTIDNPVFKPIIANKAEIDNIQQLNEDENTAHEVTFTNNKEAIPDTGLDFNTTPYILVLGIVVAGAGVLLFGRRKRWS